MAKQDEINLAPADLVSRCYGHKRQADITDFAGCVPDTLCNFLIVRGTGLKDVGNEFLRVSVVEGKECGLYLNHDAVTGWDGAFDHGQREGVFDGLVGFYGRRVLEAGAIAATEDVNRHGELVAVHIPWLSYQPGERAI